MEHTELLKRIEELEREIALLPRGSVAVKRINDKEYYYHRINENGKRREMYVDFEKAAELRAKIEKRKALEKELKELKRQFPKTTAKPKTKQLQFATYVRVGEQLDSMTATVTKYKKRACYRAIHDYVFGEQQDKVFVLYGLRRTGKTTLIRQIILNMKPEERQKAAFIQIKSSDTLSDINADLRTLEEQGYKYIFVDEVTLMEDFIEGAALFSDIYAGSGMKLVLSGTDSLGFIFTKHEQLYDRCIMLHTTFITYREFEQVLGIQGIDNYIRYGGTMSISGVNYNDSTFTTKQSTDEYIDSAIARNIQHSLKYYQDGGHFRNLYDLYEKGELTSAINRVVEDINHRFTKEVLTRTFSSHDLSLSARNLLHDRKNPVDLYQTIDKEAVTATLKSMLDILNKEDQKVEINEAHAAQIKEYLAMLDLLMEVDLQYLPHVNRRGSITVITQPGMRYAQATALVNSMLLDEKFSTLSAVERKRILERILSEIKGRMMEDIVLLETKLANPGEEVFQLQFAVGEFDMVVVDSKALTCEIFEIKYSKEIVPAQYRHLIDEEKCAQTEHRYGTITARTVIYRGETTESDNIKYINVEEYLKLLGQKK